MYNDYFLLKLKFPYGYFSTPPTLCTVPLNRRGFWSKHVNAQNLTFFLGAFLRTGGLHQVQKICKSLSIKKSRDIKIASQVGRYLYVEYRNNVRLSQVNAKSCLNLFRLIFYEVKTSLRSRTGTRKNGRQNISIMLL